MYFVALKMQIEFGYLYIITCLYFKFHRQLASCSCQLSHKTLCRHHVQIEELKKRQKQEDGADFKYFCKRGKLVHNQQKNGNALIMSRLSILKNGRLIGLTDRSAHI